MKLGKKLATLGLVGIMVIGQSISAFAAYEFKLNVGYGRPQVLGDEIYHSMTVTLSYSQETYLGVDMKLAYSINGATAASGYVNTSNKDKTIKQKSIGSFKSWRDSGSALSRVYGKYDAYGYRSFGGSTGWDLVKSLTGNVNDLL